MSDQLEENQSHQSKRPEVSSRLIVKSLPKHVTEARLKQHFQQKGGVVTDVKIMKTPDGKSRLFGFVGFATPKEAKAAKKYFDKTYLDTSKLFVDYARPKGDSEIPRAWSKYTEGSSRHAELIASEQASNEVNPKKRTSDQITKSPESSNPEENMSEAKRKKLEEFLSISAGKSTKLWENDGGVNFDRLQVLESSKESAKGKKQSKADKKVNTEDSNKSKSKTKQNKLENDDMEIDPNEAEKVLKEQESDHESDDDEYQDFSKLSKKNQKKKQKNESEESDESDESEDESSEDESNESDESDESDQNDDSRQKSRIDHKNDSKSSDAKTKPKKSDKNVKPSKSDDDSSDDDIPDLEPADSKLSKKQGKEAKKSKDYPEIDPHIVADTGRLFVRNLPYHATEDDIRNLFSKFGTVSEVHLSIDKLTKKSKGFAFVLFLFPSHAIEAYKQLDGSTFQGRILHVLPALDPKEAQTTNQESNQVEQASQPEKKSKVAPGPQLFGTNGPNNTSSGWMSEYQQKKLTKQKAMANQDYNWNSLFIRPDAVASAMANSLNVAKSDILDAESSSSMAVRLALGETNIIKETKDFLAAEGVSLDALKGHYNKDIVRSTTIILAKNIPINTQVDELRNMFGRFGTLGRVIMPPSRTMSLIEFHVPSEARAAFKNLAYKQFKDAPLFLEWAPVGVLATDEVLKPIEDNINKTVKIDTPSDSNTEIIVSEPKVITQTTQDKNTKKVEVDENSVSAAVLSKIGSLDSAIQEASLTLFIKNLSFSTTEESLRKLVEGLVGEVSNVSIATHKVHDEWLSQGFGFVECKTREQALKAWKSLQGTMLDGYQLQVNFSQKKEGPVSLAEVSKLTKKRKITTASNDASTKIMIKNVPFQATRKEIRDLFAPFGELKSVRLPNKPGGKGHRGFAFVEFVTPDEAANAIESLGNTHLYSRRLVIDFANEDEDIEAIREKTAAQFGN